MAPPLRMPVPRNIREGRKFALEIVIFCIGESRQARLRNRLPALTLPPMFTPKWKKEALLLAKGARKFVNYKRDLLKPDRIDEIEARRQDLLDAIQAKDLPKVEAASKQLRGTCENSLKGQQPPSWWEENVEVMFVAIVIALGLRTYVLQPFRIPTGSMQPTLNGIIGTPVAEKDWPALPTRVVDNVLRGRSYVKVVNDRDRKLKFIQTDDGLATALVDTQWLHFFSRSELFFEDNTSIRLPAPKSQIYETGFARAEALAMANGGVLPKGTVICEGTIDAGDLVLVDRISYHFRKPTRGEVFVFDTRDIPTKPKNGGNTRGSGLEDQGEAVTHYIKRLAAVPGDKLQIAPPNVVISGQVAREPGFENVYNLPLYRRPGQKGYDLAHASKHYPNPKLTHETDAIDLKIDAPPGMREYCALGDNSGNSLDSRYWGTVKEFNLVGPALFSLWPITTHHWGFIR